MKRNERETTAAVIKSQSELDTGSFIAHPELRVTDNVAAQAQDDLGHVKRVIRDAVERAGKSAGKVQDADATPAVQNVKRRPK